MSLGSWLVHPTKLTWNPNIHVFKMNTFLKGVISLLASILWFHDFFLVGVNTLYPDWRLVILAGNCGPAFKGGVVGLQAVACELRLNGSWRYWVRWHKEMWCVRQLICHALPLLKNGWCTAPVWKIIYFGQFWSELLKVAGIFCM